MYDTAAMVSTQDVRQFLQDWGRRKRELSSVYLTFFSSFEDRKSSNEDEHDRVPSFP